MKYIRRFMAYYKPYWRILAADLFCAVLIGIVGVAFPLIIRYLTTTVFQSADVQTMITELLWFVLALFVLYIVQALAQYYMTSWGHIMGARMESDMRSDLFRHLEKLSFSYFDRENTGRLMARLTTDLFDVTELAHHGPENVFISLIKIVGAFIVLLTIHVPTTFVLMIFTLAKLIFSGYYNRKMRRTFMENRKRIADINAVIQDSLAGIRTVQSFSNERIERAKFEHGNRRFFESKKENYLIMGQYHSINGFLQGILYLSVILTGGYFVVHGQMAAADIVIYILYINMYLDPLKMMLNFNEQFQKGMTGFQRMIEVLETEPDVEDLPHARDAGSLAGDIVFHDVSFQYDPKEPVLDHINLTIPARTTVALVGPSGVGKTTFCSLIPRFYDVTAGRITIDGHDIRDLTLSSLRANIGVVQQDVYIFNSSIRENIAYGAPGASDEEIERAARQANIHDFIMSLPDGYDTLMGERGVRFSGGQKQRISIARVFLKNPPILILDEATSSLDNESERFVQVSLTDLAKERTTIVIAHRLTTIRNADEILVLTEEGIVERGSHDDLLARDGYYANLYQLQFQDQ